MPRHTKKPGHGPMMKPRAGAHRPMPMHRVGSMGQIDDPPEKKQDPATIKDKKKKFRLPEA